MLKRIHPSNIYCSFFVLAGLFEQKEIYEKAFRYAIDSINQKRDPEDFILVPLVHNDVAEDRPFPTLQYTCALLGLGIVGVLGPRSFHNIETVQSACDAKEIPHIITR